MIKDQSSRKPETNSRHNYKELKINSKKNFDLRNSLSNFTKNAQSQFFDRIGNGDDRKPWHSSSGRRQDSSENCFANDFPRTPNCSKPHRKSPAQSRLNFTPASSSNSSYHLTSKQHTNTKKKWKLEMKNMLSDPSHHGEDSLMRSFYGDQQVNSSKRKKRKKKNKNEKLSGTVLFYLLDPWSMGNNHALIVWSLGCQFID